MAKIGMDNVVSLKLFQEKLNFSKVSQSEVFQEVTLEFIAGVKTRTWVLEQTRDCLIETNYSEQR